MMNTMDESTRLFAAVKMTVTPDMAASWLESNVRNRKLDQRHVDILAQEMKAGRWRRDHHQGIAFDTNNTLIDGQHRLWAIIQSDTPVELLVCFNVPPDNIDFVDGGKTRSNVDRMNLSGAFGNEGVDNRDTATLREMTRGLKPSSKLPYSKEVELMQLHREAIRFAVEHVGTRTRGIGVSYVRAVIARAWYSVDHTKLAEFCRMLTDGIVENSDDAIVMRLRDQLMANHRVRGVKAQQEFYGKVERTLHVWLRGENRSILRPVRHEHFPLPEEVSA